MIHGVRNIFLDDKIDMSLSTHIHMSGSETYLCGRAPALRMHHTDAFSSSVIGDHYDDAQDAWPASFSYYFYSQWSRPLQPILPRVGVKTGGSNLQLPDPALLYQDG